MDEGQTASEGFKRINDEASNQMSQVRKSLKKTEAPANAWLMRIRRISYHAGQARQETILRLHRGRRQLRM